MNRNRLLIPEHPLQVLPSLAVEIGLNEALFLQQLHYWLQTSNHNHDDRYWIYNTVTEWHDQFPFWSERTIHRIIKNLRDRELVTTTDEYNTVVTDRRLWYTINYHKLNIIETDNVSSSRDCQPVIPETDNVSSSRDCQPVIPETDNVSSSSIYTETTRTETTTETTTTEQNVVVVFQNPELRQSLLNLGIPELIINGYIDKHGEPYIQEKFDLMEAAAQRVAISNHAGFLINAINKNWKPNKSSDPTPTDPVKMTAEERRSKYIPDEYADFIRG